MGMMEVNWFKEGDKVVDKESRNDYVVTHQKGQKVFVLGLSKWLHANHLKLANGDKPDVKEFNELMLDSASLGIKESRAIVKRVKQNLAKLNAGGVSIVESRGLIKAIKADKALLNGQDNVAEPTKLGVVGGSVIESGATRGKIDSVSGLLEIALSRKDGNNAFAEIGEVTPEVAEKVQLATGIDVTGYSHSVDESAIRHIFEKHGNEKTEASRGQIAVTNDDIANLAEVVMSPDKIERGDEKNTIEVSKRVGSEVLVVQEIRTGRKKLALKTMWKKPLAAHDAPQNESPAETPETDGKRALTNDLSIPQQPEKSNEPTLTDTPLPIPAHSDAITPPEDTGQDDAGNDGQSDVQAEEPDHQTPRQDTSHLYDFDPNRKPAMIIFRRLPD